MIRIIKFSALSISFACGWILLLSIEQTSVQVSAVILLAAHFLLFPFKNYLSMQAVASAALIIISIPLLEYALISEPELARPGGLVYPLTNIQANVNFVISLNILCISSLSIGFLIHNIIKEKKAIEIQESITDLHLNPLVFGLIAFFTGLLFLGSTTGGTILSTEYATLRSQSALGGSLAFSGMVFFGYAFLIVLGLSAWSISEPKTVTPKKIMFIALVVFAVVWCDLLKGNRASAGLIAVLAIMYKQGRIGHFLYNNKKIRNTIILASIAFAALIFFSLSIIRSEYVHGLDSSSFGSITTFYKRGTWMGAFNSLFGLSTEWSNNGLDYLMGKTYVDYLLSLPPSPISNALGYYRPINSFEGPGWWYVGYTAGGLSPAIVPFKNFGALGILAVVSITGYYIAALDLMSRRASPIKQCFAYASGISLLHWFWYGDMYFIRASMAALIVVSIFYFFQIRTRRTRRFLLRDNLRPRKSQVI